MYIKIYVYMHTHTCIYNVLLIERNERFLYLFGKCLYVMVTLSTNCKQTNFSYLGLFIVPSVFIAIA